MAVEFKFTGDASQLAGEYDKLGKKVEQLEAKNKKLADAARGAGRGAKESAEAQSQGANKLSQNLDGAIAKWGGVSMAIEFATSALKNFKADQDAAFQNLAKLQDSNRNLRQVATSAEDLKALTQKRDELAQTHGVSRDRVANVLFAARSEGFEEQADDLVRYDPVVKAEAAAAVAGQVPALFNNKIGSAEAVNLTLAAAQKSRLNFEAVAQAMPTAASGGSMAGASPEETFATLAVMAAQFKSGDAAATGMKGFGTKVGLDERFKGMGFVESIEKLKGDEALRKEFLGSSIELNEFYEKAAPRTAEITSEGANLVRERRLVGSDSSIMERNLQQALVDQKLVAELNVARAEIGKEIAGEDRFAVQGGEATATRSDIEAEMDRRGANAFQKEFAKRTMDFAEGYVNSPTILRGAAAFGEYGGSGNLQDVINPGAVAKNAFEAGGPVQLLQQILAELKKPPPPAQKVTVRASAALSTHIE